MHKLAAEICKMMKASLPLTIKVFSNNILVCLNDTSSVSITADRIRELLTRPEFSALIVKDGSVYLKFEVKKEKKTNDGKGMGKNSHDSGGSSK